MYQNRIIDRTNLKDRLILLTFMCFSLSSSLYQNRLNSQSLIDRTTLKEMASSSSFFFFFFFNYFYFC
jgi:hypothetical protein